MTNKLDQPMTATMTARVDADVFLQTPESQEQYLYKHHPEIHRLLDKKETEKTKNEDAIAKLQQKNDEIEAEIHALHGLIGTHRTLERRNKQLELRFPDVSTQIDHLTASTQADSESSDADPEAEAEPKRRRRTAA